MIRNLKDKDMVYVDAAFEEFSKRATEKAQKKLEWLKARAKRYKGMDIALLKEDVNKELDARQAEEVMGYTADEYIERRHEYWGMPDYDYNKAREKNPEELVKIYNNRIEEWREDIKRCNQDIAREQYFLFNNMTPEQEEEYYKYYYALALSRELDIARKNAIYKVTREKKKKTHIMDYERLSDRAYTAVDRDVREIQELATVGTIERVKLIDERQTRIKKQTKDSLNKIDSDFDALLWIGGTGLCGALSLGLEAIVNSGPINTPLEHAYWAINILSRFAISYAALLVFLFKKGYNRTEPGLVEEAKKLGVYDTFLKSREAFREYSEYCEKLLEEYNIDSDVSRERRAYNGF